MLNSCVCRNNMQEEYTKTWTTSWANTRFYFVISVSIFVVETMYEHIITSSLLELFHEQVFLLFERSEFLIATSQKKNLCVCSTNLGLSGEKKLCVCSTNLGFSVGHVLCIIYVCTTLYDTRYVLCTRYVYTRYVLCTRYVCTTLAVVLLIVQLYRYLFIR